MQEINENVTWMHASLVSCLATFKVFGDSYSVWHQKNFYGLGLLFKISMTCIDV